MKVILLQDVKGQGKKDTVINVSDGYANNYLIKNKMAVTYTKRSNEILANELDHRKQKEDELISQYNLIKGKLEDKELIFKVSAGVNDKVFGSISTKQISEKINEIGINIDKKCIKPNDTIDSLGSHLIEIELHKKIKFNIKVILVK